MDHSKASARLFFSNQSASGAPASNNDASGITLLLADNAKFGFAERYVWASVCTAICVA
jgi:hypothetical protein